MMTYDASRTGLAAAAETFCTSLPHTLEPYNSRAWGHSLHSLCSYQGKLKPAIAAHLIERFTLPGDRVLDPLSGAGTIPLEAHLQGRVAFGNDLQELGYILTLAKISNLTKREVAASLADLEAAILAGEDNGAADLKFGFNGPVEGYFHERTLRELVSARSWLKRKLSGGLERADAFVAACLMHVLHGNRPYALSRTSHPVTPFAPSGPTEYRSVIEKVTVKAMKTLSAPKLDLAKEGHAHLGDFRSLKFEGDIDVVVTSPPFAASTRFYISNWMRLWLAGWNQPDFAERGAGFLETQQRKTREVYREFFGDAHRWLRPGGSLILHLGRTKSVNMAAELSPIASDAFETVFLGEESVLGREKFGIKDQGTTSVHQFLFLRAR